MEEAADTGSRFARMAKRVKTHSDSQDYAPQQRLRRYDDLPEGVMSVIASKLELRDLVRASAACKTWSNLATYITEICLTSSSIFGRGKRSCTFYRQSFIKAVNQFLAYYGKLLPAWAHTPLRSFKICYCFHRESVLHVKSWVKFAISKGVTSIDMKLACPHGPLIFKLPPQGGPIQSPSDILAGSFRASVGKIHPFHCRFPWRALRSASRLEKLALDSPPFWASTLSRPRHYPFLKVLELSFTSLNIRQLSSIFDACPNIESVRLSKHGLFDSTLITGEGTCDESIRTIEKLEEASLAKFQYAGVGAIFFESTCVAQLTDISYCLKTEEGINYAFEKLHLDFPSMRTLSITLDSHSVSHLHDRMASLHKLQKLELFCSSSGKFSILTMMKILEASPHLTTFSMVPPYTLEQESHAGHGTFFHERLKTVKLYGFGGHKDHAELLKMLIQVSDLDHLIISKTHNLRWQ